MDYKKAGVDIAAGDALVQWLKDQPESTSPHKDRLVSGIGGFAALFRADFPKMKKPLLVSATDGVGTKVKMAARFKEYDKLGQDLVAMCVNDLICCGADPLFFLDYYATGKLELEVAKEFMSGVYKACDEAQCLLIGGETAEMPGVYQAQDFDCAGFAVGVVDEGQLRGKNRLQVGAELWALPSSGFHSNGFSLLRKILDKHLEEWKEPLLRPTSLYVNVVKNVLESPVGDSVLAMANITGGGIDNLLRVVPDNMSLDLEAWRVPEMFLRVKELGSMAWADILRTLNCGIGFVFFVAKGQGSKLESLLRTHGFAGFPIGSVIESKSTKPSWSLDVDKLAARDNL